MKRNLALVLAIILILSMQRGPTSMAQSPPVNVVAELPGNTIIWLEIAAREFHQINLDMSNYTASIIDEQDSVLVVLTPLDQANGARGSIGKHPGYEVEMSKKSMKVLRSNYTR